MTQAKQTPVAMAEHNPELYRQIISSLDRINQRLGWMLGSGRTLTSSSTNTIRNMMKKNDERIAVFIDKLEDVGEPIYNITLLAVPQAQIICPDERFKTKSEEIHFMQQLELRMREVHSAYAGLNEKGDIIPDRKEIPFSLDFLIGHIRSIKFYIQAL